MVCLPPLVQVKAHLGMFLSQLLSTVKGGCDAGMEAPSDPNSCSGCPPDGSSTECDILHDVAMLDDDPGSVLGRASTDSLGVAPFVDHGGQPPPSFIYEHSFLELQRRRIFEIYARVI